MLGDVTAGRRARILVIGGTQFIGRATVQALLAQGHSVTLLNRGKTANPFDGQVERVVLCDRREQPEVLRATLQHEDGGWDAVVDFLAFEPKDVQPLIEISREYVRAYILISTDSVYMAVDPNRFICAAPGRLGEASDAGGQADAARAKEDEYGADKLATELALSKSALPVLALRLPDVIGPNENTGRMEKLLLKLLKGRRIGTRLGFEADHSELPPGATLGTQLPLSVVSAEDVATAVCAAVQSRDSWAVNGAWPGAESSQLARSGQSSNEGNATARAIHAVHVCADETPTWAELVRMFEAALRRHDTLDCPELRLDDGRESGFVSVDCGALDNGLAKNVLSGWAPLPLEQRICEAVDWWLAEMRRGFEQIGGGGAKPGTSVTEAAPAKSQSSGDASCSSEAREAGGAKRKADDLSDQSRCGSGL